MNMPNMSNWRGWNSGKGGEVLDERAVAAEARLNAIKKSAKIFKKGVDDSLKTNPKSGKEDLESRRRRTTESLLGEHVASAVHILNEEKGFLNPAQTPHTDGAGAGGAGGAAGAAADHQQGQLYPSLQPSTPGAVSASSASACGAAALSTQPVSPLNTLLERFANLEKTLGHMVATNEAEIFQFMQSDTPMAHLLAVDIPAVAQAKADLERLIKRQNTSQNNLEKEDKKLDKLRHLDDPVDETVLDAQEEKRERLAYELENVKKDVALEKDKLSSTLLTLVARENRYAQSVLELMRLKKSFYENAFRTIEAELPYVERLLQDTPMRPVFGEPLHAHLGATRRTIAYPIAIAVSYLRETDLNDEGLFRISPKQIKLDKLKAGLDTHQSLCELLPEDADAHLMAALLKCYLRELPEPLLGNGQIFQQWVDAVKVPDPATRIAAMRHILNDDLNMSSYQNIQYLIEFLAEVTQKCEETKMTSRNIAIVLGPTLLCFDTTRDATAGVRAPPVAAASFESASVDAVIAVVVTLIDNYAAIFPEDLPSDLEPDVREAVHEFVLTQRAEAMALEEEQAAAGARHSLLQVPPRPGQPATASASASAAASAADLAASSSPNHKRKASIRSMGRNFMNKINNSAASASHPASSKTPSPKEDHGGRDAADRDRDLY